jgi:acyl-CoA synthetase (AMP-forming)/AMP-acid ligase II
MQLRQMISQRMCRDDLSVFPCGGEVPIKAGQLRREYSSVRSFIQAHSSGRLVGIELEYGYRYFLAILACMELGIGYVPLRRTWPRARIAQIRELTGLGCVLTEEENERIFSYSGRIDRQPLTPDTNGILYVICTSGTSGEPKAVAISRKAYCAFLGEIDKIFSGISGSTRWLMMPDFTVDMSLMDIGLFILRGFPLHFTEFESNIFQLAAEIETHEIQGLNTVPNNVSMLVSDGVVDRCDISSLSHLLIGGARFPEELLGRIRSRCSRECEVFNIYGPTEITICSHIEPLRGVPKDHFRGSHATVGNPFPFVQCRLEAADGSPIHSPGVEGELLLGGGQVMLEYLGRPEATERAVRSIDGVRYYRTGDLAYCDEQGRYYVTGRNDETLKRRGYRVNLHDIDAYIRRIPGVEEVATIALPHPGVDHILVTFARSERTSDELRSEMVRVLALHQVPDIVVPIDRFPLNNAAKICRMTLSRRAREMI